ncbi:AmmeMemoRadiSam system protein B [Geobacter sp.]|uniref:AmmeMemoRadiSam system protein B n=1 Tax=Geobacter sp. TaxID=46610 RepID=UPI002624C34E|nr:AmmeMemoRadiSam system protein B [Geobacter sp.]
MIRQPAVAGQFYTDDPCRLRAELRRMTPTAAVKSRVAGIVAPHAGYLYSGGVAGTIYGAIDIPRTVIILGPNHHGFGAAAALHPPGEWLTPLGPVPISGRLSSLIMENTPLVEFDASAHRFEHSLEVQLPFLQHLRDELQIVPICLGFGDFERCRQVGEGVARAILAFGEEVLIVASSDMTHYESAEAARVKDELALARVCALDPEGLVKLCRARGITMCGVIPTAVMLVAAELQGAEHGEVVRYGTSGDVTGDDRQVVAYAAVAVY